MQFQWTKLSIVLGFVAAFASAQSSFAVETVGISDAFHANQEIIQNFKAGNILEPAQAALNVMVANGIAILKDAGENATADQLEGEWNSDYKDALTSGADFGSFSGNSQGSLGVGIMDLGDHAPLSPWLAKFHDTLLAKSNGMVTTIRLVQDIDTLNYALQVVLHPKKKGWQSGNFAADSIEYRKHFIPFANIITYWVTLEACNYVTVTHAPQFKTLCKPAASKLEWVMGRYVAYHVSDWIYAQANHQLTVMDALQFDGYPYSTEASFESDVLSSSGNI